MKNHGTLSAPVFYTIIYNNMFLIVLQLYGTPTVIGGPWEAGTG